MMMMLALDWKSSAMLWPSGLMLMLAFAPAQSVAVPHVLAPVCEPIRIDMCAGIGYNETTMPNLVGHELQSEIEFTLQTFAPLIEYACSSQLKLFLCAAYVPMCTPKAPLPIGPCRNLCENVRFRCHPVLQGFGFPWPPALDCSRFPKENNHETMCMEGPGEANVLISNKDMNMALSNTKTTLAGPRLECPDLLSTHSYVKLHRSGRCASLCEANILFSQYEKHLAEVWVTTWSYATLGLGVIATLFLILEKDKKHSSKWSQLLTPLVWCHNLVAIGWTVRFISGRNATACGYDPQVPNVSILLVDGLSNASCASTFMLRYYFGMAALVWWAILCLGWHRDIRRKSHDNSRPTAGGGVYPKPAATISRAICPPRGETAKKNNSIMNSNAARFAAWGLPAFQTVAVIVSRLVDADELLGACYVGNQSDKGLQILVATPLFCYWIFGSMNLISGFLVYRRNVETQNGLQQQRRASKGSGIGTFLFIYCVPCGFLLFAVIYEFTNIDVWLSTPLGTSASMDGSTPLWPFLMRAFMELMLGIISSAWVLGPKISTMYKKQLGPRCTKQRGPVQPRADTGNFNRNARHTKSLISYHSVRRAPVAHSECVLPINPLTTSTIGRHKHPAQFYGRHDTKINKAIYQYGSEIIL